MKALVIGLGSMGRRRARLLKKVDDSITIIGFDKQAERRKQAENELVIKTEDSLEFIYEKYNPDCAFVCTSPLSHASIINGCLKKDMHVFTELNLTDSEYATNVALAKEKGKVLFLSSTFLYREEVRYIQSEVSKCNCKLSYTYHVGQYLPDWHPWESYKNFFVGIKATNGCREFMAIDFPWLIETFGAVTSVYSIKSKTSSLDVDFPDTYQIVLEHESGHKGLVTVDVVSRKPVRNLELFGENLYITWNGTPDGLFKYDFEKKEEVKVSTYNTPERRKEYCSFVIENAYLSEIISFFDVINGKNTSRYSFEKDKYVLSLIDKIEAS